MARTPFTRWLLLIALLLTLGVACGLRLAGLPRLPLGLHYDEAANGILAGEIARGIRQPVFISAYTGKEVLFFYWAAAWMRVLGQGVLALRLTAAVAGLCTVGAAAWAAYELLHDRRDAGWVAVLTAAFVATSFWHLVLSRIGFRAITQPLLQALTVAALWRGLRLERRGWLVLAGLLCGATAYTYLAARAFPVPLAGALLALLVAERGRRRARLGQVALFVAVAALAVAPLALYFYRHPSALTTRMAQVAASSWGEAWIGFRACLEMFFLRGDPYVRFNLPGRPLFDPLSAILFLLGLPALFLRSGRRTSAELPASGPRALAARVFVLVSLPVMLLPSALAAGEITPSNLRAVGLLPFVYVFPALTLAALAGALSRAHRLPRIAFGNLRYFALVLLVLVLAGIPTARLYFRDWARSSELYDAADGDLVDVAAYLNDADLTGVVPYVASIHYRHPTIAFLAEDYPAIKWVKGGNTLVFPAEGEGLLVLPRSANAGRTWMEALPEGLTLRDAPPGPGGRAAFHAYRLHAVPGYVPAYPLAADLGHVVTVLGADLLEPSRSGETVEALFGWRVESAAQPGDLLASVSLVDAWGNPWGDARPFHYPAEQWAPGELVLDRISVPIAPGAPPGDYRLQLGFFAASTGTALPVLDAQGAFAGTAVEVTIPVERAAAPPDPDEMDIRRRLDLDGGAGLTLLGANLDTSSVRPREPIHLTLFWRADRDPEFDVTVRLDLGESALYQDGPVRGSYPTHLWTAGEIVVDRYAVRPGLEVAPGSYPLRLALLDSDGAILLETVLGDVTVRAVERVFEAPAVARPVGAVLGDAVELVGIDLQPAEPSPGDALTLTLVWRALAEMDISYTVFTHLVDADGRTVAQHDGVPAGGTYPTTLWASGEVVADAHVLDLPADLSPGALQLEVGLYLVESGTRLGIAGSGDDAVRLPLLLSP
jgi:hypothetical protein